MYRITEKLARAALWLAWLFLAPLDGRAPGASYLTLASPEGPDSDGVALAADGTPQGLHGTAVPQPANPAQAAASFALGQSAVVVYATVQSPALIAANTTAERAFTVTGVLAGSLVFVNKPTVQAGLGVVGARVSAADTVQVAFSNSTAGNVTPTATQIYLVVEIRGPLLQTAALTFGAEEVPANGTREFEFDITPGAGLQGLSSAQVAAGVLQTQRALASAVSPNFGGSGTGSPSSVQQPATRAPGAPSLNGLPQTVIVNKPTVDAGIGICGARLTANGRLAIRYCNVTAAGVNPTDETYTFIALRGISLRQSIVAYIVDVGTLAEVATITTAEQTRTVNGVRATDKVVGVSKPTAQAGLGIAGWRVTAANTVGITFVNPTAGGITPTADEHYTIWVDKSETGHGAVLRQFSAVIQPASVAADTVAEQTFTVTGLISGAPLAVNVAAGSDFATELGSALPFGIGVVGVRASGADTLALAFLNTTAVAITPPSLMVTILQAPADHSGSVDGVDGSATVWPFDPQSVQLTEIVQQIRAALVANGSIAGA